MSLGTIRGLGAVAVLGFGMCFVGGCGKSVEGTYTDSSGMMTVEFDSGGKSKFTAAGMEVDGTYTVSGNTVTVTTTAGGNATRTLTINDDGSLTGDGVTLKKR
jgi:hypothetical protein